MNPREWLSEQIVNSVLGLEHQHHGAALDVRSTQVFESLNVLHTQGRNLQRRDQVLLPININSNHWIIARVGNRRVITIYDSMRSNRGRQDMVVRILRRGLTSSAQYRVEVADVPQQTNAIDCGVYAIAFALALMRGEDPSARSFLRSQGYQKREAHVPLSFLYVLVECERRRDIDIFKPSVCNHLCEFRPLYTMPLTSCSLGFWMEQYRFLARILEVRQRDLPAWTEAAVHELQHSRQRRDMV